MLFLTYSDDAGECDDMRMLMLTNHVAPCEAVL